MLRDPSHLVPNMPWLLVACVNAHTSTHAPHNLKPQSGRWNLLCGWSTHSFYGENDNRTVFPRLRGRPIPAGVSEWVHNIHPQVCVLSSWANLYLLCDPPYWDVSAPFCEYTDCRGVWLSCACQNELTSQTTGPLNVTAKFIRCETHCVSLSVPFENEVWNATNVNQN